MRRSRSNARRALIAGGVVFALFACNQKDDDNFREDVIYCEDALSRLTNCCGPGFAPTKVDCFYDYEVNDNGCSTQIISVNPDIAESDSRCILGRDCNTLISSGVCMRAQIAHQTPGQAGSVCQ